MNQSTKQLRVAGALLAAGGLCWVIKFVVIAATDGAVSGLPDQITSILYISAVLLMALGMAGIGFALAARQHLVVRLLCAVGGLVAWVLTYSVIERVTQALVGSTDPTWLHDEIGIVATGGILLAVGVLVARPRVGDSAYAARVS